jgi:hypothetical protein
MLGSLGELSGGSRVIQLLEKEGRKLISDGGNEKAGIDV